MNNFKHFGNRMKVTFTTIIRLLQSFYKSNEVNSDINLEVKRLVQIRIGIENIISLVNTQDITHV
jgi:hypothetical protein